MDKERNNHAAQVLRKLDEMGAISLDVLTAKASEVQGVTGATLDDDGDRICYPFYIRVGPRHDLDLVSVANQVKQLGFELRRVNQNVAKG